MTVDEIIIWWCCQSSQTRSTLTALLILYASDPYTTLKAVFDALMTVAGYPTDGALYINFITTFQLSFAEADVEGVPTDFLVFDPVFWTALASFAVIPGLGCAEPCYILKFSQDHI